MRKVLITLWIHVSIPILLCVTSTALAEQESTEVRDLQYVETVDLRELVKTVGELATNVSELTKNQKELTKSVNDLSTRMTGFDTRMTGFDTRMTGVETSITGFDTRMTKVETRMAVIEERTAWIRGLLYLILAAIIGSIVTPITLHILSIRAKKNSDTTKVNEPEKSKNESEE